MGRVRGGGTGWEHALGPHGRSNGVYTHHEIQMADKRLTDILPHI
jgi:hypothetical protein